MDRLICKIRPYLLAWLRRSRSGKVPSLRHFTYRDVKKATDGFHRIIYSNSHGIAYKARFRDGDVALVKELKGFDERKDEFNREVQLVGRLHHRHILALEGFSTGRKRLLIFGNIENGSLREHLNDPLKTPLNWRTRLQIAIGVAAALEYLLLFCNPPVYHVSISSSSIILDENFTAKLSDISLLSSVEDYAQMSSDGLRSKEFVGQICGDVIFQLGVLILELVTGQSSEKGSTDLIQWIQQPHISHTIQKMIDPDLGNNYNSRELKNLLAVARLCIKSGKSPKFSISQISRFLQKKEDIPDE